MCWRAAAYLFETSIAEFRVHQVKVIEVGVADISVRSPCDNANLAGTLWGNAVDKDAPPVLVCRSDSQRLTAELAPLAVEKLQRQVEAAGENKRVRNCPVVSSGRASHVVRFHPSSIGRARIVDLDGVQ